MIKAIALKPFAALVSRKVEQMRSNAIRDQWMIFHQLLQKGRQCRFGLDHDFGEIMDYNDFQERVPLADYEQLKSYFDSICQGEKDVLWPGKPKYLAKTSGTTSGIKYIPITTDSLPNHIETARTALLNYASQGRNSRLFNGKLMFLSGSPVLSDTGGIPTGRLSGIVNHEIPAWLSGNQLPSYATNCIEDWEEKLEAIVRETIHSDLRLISGIPPWVQMYFERILALTGRKNVKEIFPNLQLFIYGGVNYLPYKESMESLIGGHIDSLEMYPASEGFIAFQDKRPEDGLLLNTSSGIFFEFVRLNDIAGDSPERIMLEEVEIGQDYAIVINNNAGLWAYNIGDTVRFVSKDPYRLIVSGRVKHFISAFGEHVIAKEVEEAMQIAALKHDVKIIEFTVAPEVNPPNKGPAFHEWLVEFETEPRDFDSFSRDLDREMCRQNIYYKDLIEGAILRPLVVRKLERNAFREYMKSMGKLGGQNKVPRLSNDRILADGLSQVGLVKV